MFLRTGFLSISTLSLWMLLANATRANSTNKVIFVDAGFQGSSPTGESWLSAYPSLQDAIDAAAKNNIGEIWIRRGTYIPQKTGRKHGFNLPAGISLYGGFRGDETSRDKRNPKAFQTILSGDIGKFGMDQDNCYHVLTAGSESTISGLTITKGFADGRLEAGYGGGLLLRKGSLKTFISDCSFAKNHADHLGGAVYLPSSEATFTNCTFFSNVSKNNGGALATEYESILHVQASTFSANQSINGSGGAILLSESASAWLSDSFFLYNNCTQNGGAVSALASETSEYPLELNRCTFRENRAQGNGGAIYFGGPLFPAVQNCQFSFNISTVVGGIGISENCIALISDCTFGKNKGSKGAENMGKDETSAIVDSREALAQQKPKKTFKEEAELPPARMLPNLSVVKTDDAITIKLRKLVEAKKYTVLALVDPSDPEFIKTYRILEALALNHASDDLQVFYIHHQLAFPENHGLLQPFNEFERIQQSKEMAKQLKTKIPWLCDTMENTVLQKLPPHPEERIFIYSADGAELFSGSLQTPRPIMDKLIELLGAPQKKIHPNQLPEPTIEPLELEPPKWVKRIYFNPQIQHFVPLKLVPRDSRLPHYVKLRAEADSALLKTGNGNLYLGFHIDPLYKAQWNNSGTTLNYTIIPTGGTVTPSTQSAPRIREACDGEPREFVITAEQQNTELPLLLKVTYSVYLPSLKSTIDVTQEYLIYLQEDPLGGQAYRRQIAYRDPAPKTYSAESTAIPSALRRYDADGNGKLTRNEVKGTLYSKFPEIDTNRDGYLNSTEYNRYLRTR